MLSRSSVNSFPVSSTQSIGKLLGHKAGSSMTVMYADFADDEAVDLVQNVLMDGLQNLVKNEQ